MVQVTVNGVELRTVRGRAVTVGDVREIIALLPDDAPVEILYGRQCLGPTGAGNAPTAGCVEDLQLFVEVP